VSTDHVPKYRRHRQSGQAIVTLPDGVGGRRDVLLGPYGTKASRVKYARQIAEWEAAGRSLAPPALAKDLSVNELVLAFARHAAEHYRRPDGTPSKELADFKLSLRPLRELYGNTEARDFGPLKLKALREHMIESGWCRGVINQRIGRVRRVFRWAVEQELVPPAILQGLQAVRGLQRGRSAARETEPVKSVPEAFVQATLPFLLPPVAAMVQLQLLTGMRPGEAVVMRAIDIDMTGKVWLYRPGSDRGPHGEHKTSWRGHDRIIALGPRAQAVIRPFLGTDVGSYLFRPTDAVAELRRRQRANRNSRVQPSQESRKKPKPKKRPGDHYTTSSYGKAIRAACLKADAHEHRRLPEIPADQVLVPCWHPNQLRHTKATEIRREFGLDASRAVLGHRASQVTEVYAELDTGKAAEVMARLG
jgi:integrase